MDERRDKLTDTSLEIRRQRAHHETERAKLFNACIVYTAAGQKRQARDAASQVVRHDRNLTLLDSAQHILTDIEQHMTQSETQAGLERLLVGHVQVLRRINAHTQLPYFQGLLHLVRNEASVAEAKQERVQKDIAVHHERGAGGRRGDAMAEEIKRCLLSARTAADYNAAAVAGAPHIVEVGDDTALVALLDDDVKSE